MILIYLKILKILNHLNLNSIKPNILKELNIFDTNNEININKCFGIVSVCGWFCNY